MISIGEPLGGSGYILSLGMVTIAPTTVEAMMVGHVTGLGDNRDFIGVSGASFTALDHPNVTWGTRGVLYGMQLSVQPLLPRTNSPADDVDCLVMQNDSPNGSIGTDCMYIGHGGAFANGAAEWNTLFASGANANTGFALGGVILEYAFDTALSTVGKGVVRGPNSVPLLVGKWRPGWPDIEVVQVDWDGNVLIPGDKVNFANTPTTDPHWLGRIWNNNGVLMISQG